MASRWWGRCWSEQVLAVGCVVHFVVAGRNEGGEEGGGGRIVEVVFLVFARWYECGGRKFFVLGEF